MVYEQKCAVIIMLTAEVEQDRMKCFGYWPASVKRTLDDGKIRVDCLGVSVLQNYVATRVQITDLQTRKVHEVRHVRYKEWPEHGVPVLTRAFVTFLDNVSKMVHSTTEKILVHCSSGAGRSGVFVTTYLARAIFHELATWDTDALKAVTADSLNNIFSTADVVQTLRHFRCPFIVRTKAQYTFCFRVIADLLLTMTEDPANNPITLIRGQSDINFEGGAFLGLDPDDEMRGLDLGTDYDADDAMHSTFGGVASMATLNVVSKTAVTSIPLAVTVAAGGGADVHAVGIQDGPAVSDSVAARRQNREARRKRVQALKDRTQKRRAERASEQQQYSGSMQQPSDKRSILDTEESAAVEDGHDKTPAASDKPKKAEAAAAPVAIPTIEEESTLERLLRLTKRLAFGGPEADVSQQVDVEGNAHDTEQSIVEDDEPLPEGWIKKIDTATLRVFFANLITKETTWIDPRKPTSNLIPADFKFVDWNELSVGWERVVNSVGDLYFANHNSCTTSWFPPRDIRQAEHVDELEAAAVDAHMQLKLVQGAIDVLEREKTARRNALGALQQQAKELQERVAASDVSSDDRLKCVGQIELLHSQIAREDSLIQAREDGMVSMEQNLFRYSEKIRAIEQVEHEFSAKVTGAAQMNRSRMLAERQFTLANQLKEHRKLCMAELSRLAGHWQKVCAENAATAVRLQDASTMVFAAPTDISLSEEAPLHVGIDGNLKTDCAMKITALVVEFVLLNEIEDIRKELALLEAEFVPRVLNEASSAGSSQWPGELVSMITPSMLERFRMRAEHASKIPAAFTSSVNRLLGPSPTVDTDSSNG